MKNNKVKITLFSIIGIISATIYLIRPQLSSFFIIIGFSTIVGLLIRFFWGRGCDRGRLETTEKWECDLSMFKKIFKFLCIFIIFIIIYMYTPIKVGIKHEHINFNENYIIVTPTSVTVATWRILEAKDGDFSENPYVRLSGNYPESYNYELECGHNYFVCYGDFTEKGYLYGEEYHNFIVDNWDIITPIKRDTLFGFLYPKNYLCQLDCL